MDENRIIEVRTYPVGESSQPWPYATLWEVAVTKAFAEEHGGGQQTFRENGGSHLHRALDVAREMVTVSPGKRTDLAEVEQ